MVLLFWALCIPLRILIAAGSMWVPERYLTIFGMVLSLIGLSMLYLFFTNKRLNATEAGGATWWAPLRLLFGGLYLMAGIYAIQGKQKFIFIPLMLDVILGITASLFNIYV